VRPDDRHRCPLPFGDQPVQGLHPARMIEMAVGQEDLLDGQVLRLEHFDDARRIAARIDHRRPLRLVIPKDAAILLQGCDGDDGSP
jgi:hypothetical protein